MNKKAEETLNWPELACFFAILLGFLFALSSNDFLTRCIVLFIVALAFGRMIYFYVHHQQVHLLFMVVGFIIGFLLVGDDLRFVLTVFAGGIALSYYVHKKKLVPSFK